MTSTFRRKRVALVFVLPLYAPSALAAQTLATFQFTPVAVEDSTSYLVYRYRVSNGTASTGGIAGLLLDVSAPEGTAHLTLPATGGFLDGPTANPTGAAPHVPLGPISPANWRTSLRRTGILAWSGANGRMLDNDSIPAGTTLDGLGLRSPYLPGIRAVSALPTWQSCCREPWGNDDTNPQRQLPSRDDFPIREMTVGPQYDPIEFDMTVLREQVTAACGELQWIRSVGLCDQLSQHLAAGSQFRTSLDAFRSSLQSGHSDGTVDPRAFLLLEFNAGFLARSAN